MLSNAYVDVNTHNSYHSKDEQFAHLDLKYLVYRLTPSHNIYNVMKSLSPYPQFDSFVAQI